MDGKRLVVVALAVVSLAFGMVDQWFYPGHPSPPTGVAYMLLGVFLIFLWYRMDSTQLGYRRSPWLNVGVVALAAVALPYYFFRSRGMRRGAISTLVFVLAFIASGVLYAAGTLAAQSLGGSAP